jgi:hypothetical protein
MTASHTIEAQARIVRDALKVGAAGTSDPALMTLLLKLAANAPDAVLAKLARSIR